jgi:DNA polymerase-3 subunit delta'
MNHLLPWQNDLYQSLVTQFQASHLPHAMLLHGAVGSGGLQLATALSERLLCHGNDVNPCGHCKSCQLLATGYHPDRLMIQPEEAGKALKVDQIRTITEFSAQTAQQGGVKIIVIEPADAMNVNAANALLKVLEEPQGDTFLLLVTERLEAILPTIKSRCRLQKLGLPDRSQAIVWLKEQSADKTDEQWSQLLGLALGSPLTVLSLLEGNRLDVRDHLVEGLTQMMKGQCSPVELAQQWQKHDPKDIFYWFMMWFSELVRFVASKGQSPITDDKAAKLLKFSAAKCELDSLFSLCDHILKVRAGLLAQKNLNNQLVLEEVLIRWHRLLGGA